jgi:hypothetical protein
MYRTGKQLNLNHIRIGIGPRNPKPSSHTSATLFIYRYHHDKDACRNGFVSRRYDQCSGSSKTLSLRHDYMKATYNHILGIYNSTANTPNNSLWLSTSFSLPSCGGQRYGRESDRGYISVICAPFFKLKGYSVGLCRRFSATDWTE